MSILSTLKLAADEDPKAVSPFVAAKAALLANLKMQLKAAEAMVAGEEFFRERFVVEKDAEGNKNRVTKKFPVRKWYWRDIEGNVRFAVRVGNKRVELEKGKPNIVVGDDKNLPSVIEAVLSAVEAGELDEPIKAVVDARTPRKKVNKTGRNG